MAKRATKTAKPVTILQTPDGAEAKPEVAAAATGAVEAKVAEADGAANVDPAGAGAASAAAPEQSRETADAPAADHGTHGSNTSVGNPSKADADEGKQPGATPRPPVADVTIVRVSTKRPQGRRRAGRAFGTEPVELDTSELSPLELDGLLSDPDLVIDPRPE